MNDYIVYIDGWLMVDREMMRDKEDKYLLAKDVVPKDYGRRWALVRYGSGKSIKFDMIHRCTGHFQWNQRFGRELGCKCDMPEPFEGLFEFLNGMARL